MKRRNIILIVVGALILVAAIVFLVLGLTAHEEPGLLHLEFNSRGIAQYAQTPEDASEMPEFSGWSNARLPLLVGVTSTREGAADDVRAAVRELNQRIGYQVLRVQSGVCSEFAICVHVGVPHLGEVMDTFGDAQHQRRSDGLHCVVRTSNEGLASILHLVLQHELGHCLGLAHDHWEGSIMCGRRPYNGRSDCTFHPPYDLSSQPRITDHDRQLLRRLYPQ